MMNADDDDADSLQSSMCDEGIKVSHAMTQYAFPPVPPLVSSFVGTETSSTLVAEPKKLAMVVKASILDVEDACRT